MMSATLNRQPSLYDTIPNLDSWYECKNDSLHEPYEIVPCAKKRKASLATVSFSTAPPAVYHYENKKEKLERPVHRRNSSSEHVKEFLKHCTSKLSRQLSSRSSASYRA